MRLTLTLPDELGEALKDRAKVERRPVSNMAALLLYVGLAEARVVVEPPMGEKVFRGPDPRKK